QRSDVQAADGEAGASSSATRTVSQSRRRERAEARHPRAGGLVEHAGRGAAARATAPRRRGRDSGAAGDLPRARRAARHRGAEHRGSEHPPAREGSDAEVASASRTPDAPRAPAGVYDRLESAPADAGLLIVSAIP